MDLVTVTIYVGRSLLALIFLVAALGKWRSGDQLRGLLQDYVGVGERASVWWIRMLGLWEAGLGLVLILTAPSYTPPVWIGAGTLVVFTVGIILLRVQGYDGGCGCFGSMTPNTEHFSDDLRRNLIFTAVAIGLLMLTDVVSAESVSRTGQSSAITLLTVLVLLGSRALYRVWWSLSMLLNRKD